MSRLAGRVAIVTGAGTGLGRETAKLYAEEGARVVVSDVRDAEGAATVEAIRAGGGEALFVRADVAAGVEVERLVAVAEEHYGALHVMTANAGILGRGAMKPLAAMTDDEMGEVIGVNLLGVMHSFKYAIPAILRSGGGAMTATSSIGAQRGIPLLPAYCASKGGVEALVRSLAAGLQSRIRVNAVTAGSMTTQILEHALEAQGADPAAVPKLELTSAIAHPRAVAEVHLFLVSEAAAFITGQSVVADGGRSAFQPA